ncbi:HAD hydrolase-like protein [Arthrobacter sp. TMN-37]
MTNSQALVLFDLDGTVIDPAGAITGGIGQALRDHGLPVPDRRRLQSMVGPALVTSLRRIAGVPDHLIDPVMGAYRAGYRSVGMAQSRPYPGMVDAVRALRADGVRVAIATQKPEWLAEELLSTQGLAGLFDSVHGAPRDERAAAALQGKSTIIAAALAAHAGRYGSAIMVGDRSHDVLGAADNGLGCVGVSWGFAVPGELAEAGALAVVDTAGELLEVLRGNL